MKIILIKILIKVDLILLSMIEKKNGVIVNTKSVSVFVGHTGQAPY